MNNTAKVVLITGTSRLFAALSASTANPEEVVETVGTKGNLSRGLCYPANSRILVHANG